MATSRLGTAFLHSQRQIGLLTISRSHLRLRTSRPLSITSLKLTTKPSLISTTPPPTMPTAAQNDTQTPNEIVAHPIPKSPETAHSKQSHYSSEEWKYKPPYRVHDSPDDLPVKHKASCHCGKVKYRLSREKPLAAKFCHCTTCQIIHGAPFQWAAIFQKEDINFSDGMWGWFVLAICWG
jgi:hypothetical protein